MAKAKVKELQRLDKIVALLTGWSRQSASRMIKDGAVRVDGVVVTDSATKVNINVPVLIEGVNADSVDEFDELEALEGMEAGSEDESAAAGDAADRAGAAGGVGRAAAGGQPLTAAAAFKKRVFLLNKPAGYVCADRDRNHNTVVSLFRKERNMTDLHCAGRLDIDTTGVLIVTDDGALNHEITSPRHQVTKVYLARLDHEVPSSAVARFASGIKHPDEDKRYRGAVLTLLSQDENAGFWAAVQLGEGRFHQVKRMFEVVGCEVQELVRVAIGSLSLANLPEALVPGSYRLLDEEECNQIMTSHDYNEAELKALLERYQMLLQSAPAVFVPAAAAAFGSAAAAGQAADGADVCAAPADKDPAEEADGFEAEDEWEEDEGSFDEPDENGELRIY